MEKLLEENLFYEQRIIKNNFGQQNEQNWEVISARMTKILNSPSSIKQHSNRNNQSKQKKLNYKINSNRSKQSKNFANLSSKNQLLDSQDKQRMQRELNQKNNESNELTKKIQKQKYQKKKQRNSKISEFNQQDKFITQLQKQLINQSKRGNKKIKKTQNLTSSHFNLLTIKQLDFIQQKQISSTQNKNREYSFQKLQTFSNLQSGQISNKLISNNFCKLIENQKNKKLLLSLRTKRNQKQKQKSVTIHSIQNKNNNLSANKNLEPYQNKQKVKQLHEPKQFIIEKEKTKSSIIHQKKIGHQCSSKQQISINKKFTKMRSRNNSLKESQICESVLQPKDSNRLKIKSNIQKQMKKDCLNNLNTFQTKNSQSISIIIQKRIQKLEQHRKLTDSNNIKIKLSSLTRATSNHQIQNNKSAFFNNKFQHPFKNINQNESQQKNCQKNYSFPIIKKRSCSQPTKRQNQKINYFELQGKNQNMKQNKKDILKQFFQDDKKQKYKIKNKDVLFHKNKELNLNVVTNLKKNDIELFKLKLKGQHNKLVILRK